MGARREVVSAVMEGCRSAKRAEKGRILGALCATTGWHRKHAVRALRRRATVGSGAVEAPRQRCPVAIVPTEDVERFEAEFVSLFTLARQQGRHHMAVKKDVAAAGVKPALDPKEVQATFYRRNQVVRSQHRKGKAQR